MPRPTKYRVEPRPYGTAASDAPFEERARAALGAILGDRARRLSIQFLRAGRSRDESLLVFTWVGPPAEVSVGVPVDSGPESMVTADRVTRWTERAGREADRLRRTSSVPATAQSYRNLSNALRGSGGPSVHHRRPAE